MPYHYGSLGALSPLATAYGAGLPAGALAPFGGAAAKAPAVGFAGPTAGFPVPAAGLPFPTAGLPFAPTVGAPGIACAPVYAPVATVCQGAIPTTAAIPTRSVIPTPTYVPPAVEYGAPILTGPVPTVFPSPAGIAPAPAFGKAALAFGKAPFAGIPFGARDAYLATPEAIVSW